MVNYDNETFRLHRELIVRIVEMFFNGTLTEKVDRVPLELRPKHGPSTRCCVYRDRALIKYRCMAIMGHRVEDETDEFKTLHEYAQERMTSTGSEKNRPTLTVLDEACSACVRSRYFVTNACRSCLARPCTLNCPKKAIEVENGQARIDPAKCVACGKCVTVCPYHAIVYVPIPCEEACPVGAIQRGENGKQIIDFDRCISCGKCTHACPFGAIMERSELLDVLKAIKNGRSVVAMVAPAMMGQFDAEPGQIVAALKAIGFSEVMEVALGADETTKLEAEEFVKRISEGAELMTSSCCWAWKEAVEKVLPNMKPFVSETPTPMHLTAQWAAKKFPDALKVFIGPCVAKRTEARRDPIVDHVLTFEEVGAIFVAKGVDVKSCSAEPFAHPATQDGRGFPVTGGVIHAVAGHVPKWMQFKPRKINGLDHKMFRLLTTFPKTKGECNFLEVMGCEEGCVGGPCTICNPKIADRRVREMAGVEPETEES
jgi:[FeFe] hydrogenase (group B1/B3)